MHVLDLPAQIRDELFTMSPGPIVPVVLMVARSKIKTGTNADGSINFSSNYVTSFIDLTDRIQAGREISLEASKPILPLDGKDNIATASRVVIQLINTDQYMAVEQLGAILEAAAMDKATITIVASLNHGSGTTIQFPLFRGRVFARPDEEFGITTIEARNELWDIVRKPVTFELFDPTQATGVVGTTLVATPYIVNGVKYYDGVTIFGQNGAALTSVENSNPGDVFINYIGVKNQAKLGRYKIVFINASDFVLTYPDNLTFQGSISGGINSDFITIPGPQIQAAPGVDLTGKQIEFSVNKTMSGHPIDIILNELEKAFTNAHGVTPTQPATLPIDYAKFAAAKTAFSGFSVFVTETNKDNKVWSKRAGNKPLNVLQFCQKIADHLLSQIVIDDYGFISIHTPVQLPGDTIHELTDDEAIIDHRVLSVKATNYYKFGYGWNDASETFSSFIIKDERQDQVNDEIIEKVIELPYYKQGLNNAEAANVAELMMGRILRSFTQIQIKVVPQFGLTMRPGDRVRIKTSTPPILDMTAEIYNSSVNVGGECVFKLVKIPDIVENPPLFCEAVLCKETFC